jgi:hypothetical protein
LSFWEWTHHGFAAGVDHYLLLIGINGQILELKRLFRRGRKKKSLLFAKAGFQCGGVSAKEVVGSFQAFLD